MGFVSCFLWKHVFQILPCLAGRQTDRQADRQTGEWTNIKQTCRHTDHRLPSPVEYDTKPTPVFVRVYVRLGVGSEAKPICGFLRQIHTHGFFKRLKPHQILPETAVKPTLCLWRFRIYPRRTPQAFISNYRPAPEVTFSHRAHG